MKKIFIILIFCGCAASKPATYNYNTMTAIHATFSCELPGDYYVQRREGNVWFNAYWFKNMAPGAHRFDTIPYIPGLYRIIGEGDSTQIFNVQ